MVKPDKPEDLSVRVLVTGIQGQAAPEGPWSSARLALETLEFQDVVDRLLPNRDELDDRNLVTLALALDALGRADESREALEAAGKTGTDAQGVLAGRLERQWNREGRRSDAERALSLYRDAYETSKAKPDWDQAYYHGINVAYMTALYLDDRDQAQAIAGEVLEHCDRAEQNHWCLASKGEARFYLGEWDGALDDYAAAVAAHASPREIESMYQQAELIIADLAPAEQREQLRQKLDAVFGW